MTRVKRGFVARKRRARVLKLAKGFRGSHSVLFRTAQQRILRALALSTSDRRQFKRTMRQLWIRRLNSFLRSNGPFEKNGQSSVVNYSGFIHQLKKSHIGMNRKVLSQLAVFDPASLIAIVDKTQMG
jgi:large subunit ribosomal protein L20